MAEPHITIQHYRDGDDKESRILTCEVTNIEYEREGFIYVYGKNSFDETVTMTIPKEIVEAIWNMTPKT